MVVWSQLTEFSAKKADEGECGWSVTLLTKTKLWGAVLMDFAYGDFIVSPACPINI